MNTEDKILIARSILGFIGGIISGVLSLFNINISLFIIIIIYSLSIFISKIFGASSKYDLYLRGTLVFFISWFLILLVIYNI
ncbi:MAG: hypothetical protein QXV69_02705 [Sulfolobaceae archaeon]